MPSNKRKVPEINSSSQADIAFSVLIFFLVVSTMDVDTGLMRLLPPMPDPNVKQEAVKVKERNLLLVFVNGRGDIMVNGKQMSVENIKEEVKTFIDVNNTNGPEIEDVEVAMPEGGRRKFKVSQGIVSLQCDRNTDYKVYIQVQNELTRAFNEARDQLSLDLFGRKFKELTKDQAKVITKAIPVKISEAEPRKRK